VLHTAKEKSGALRLDFSGGRDLSYEDIVKHLMAVPVQDKVEINSQIRRGYARMEDADPFIRELLVLLVGVEGIQNNAMVMSAPMVTDLIAEDALSWAGALFSGDRTVALKNVPAFIFAADKGMKGSSGTSEGPMERQARLLQKRRFDMKDYGQALKYKNKQAVSEGISEQLKQLATTISEEVKRRKGSSESVNRLAEIKLERAVQLEKMKDRDRSRLPTAEGMLESELKKSVRGEYEGRVSRDINRTSGYDTFRDNYMKRQFEMQAIFMETVFPQINSLNFSSEENLLKFCERLMERYLLQRFFGV
jgi:hypothetical protein